ncbi:MAG: DUF4329 domain-containing protein [Pseudomonadota bacterium]
MKPIPILLSTLAILVSTLPAKAQDAAETAFVRGLMESMNALSVRFDREVCGFILREPDGTYSSTKVSWGGHASCASLPLEEGVTVVSSWHTHAAYSVNYDNEVPSIQDVEGDIRFGVNGWVGTPGGRLWFVDSKTETIRVVCDLDCLPSDPNATDRLHPPVPQSMTLTELYGRFGRARQ